MKTLKRIFSLLICLTLVLPVIPALPVFAETYSGKCGSKVTWKLDTESGLLTISGTGDMQGYARESYVPWADQRESIKLIIIEEGVTSIGMNAFYGCTALTSIQIASEVIGIYNYAFSGCTSLTNITLPDNITYLGYGAFSNCTSLTSMTIPENVTSIDGGAFRNCSSLTDINIPNAVTNIGDNTFRGCSSLTEITLPDGILNIGYGAFEDCINLISVTIPNGVTIIGNYAFAECNSLTSINIPDKVVSIGDYAFQNCTALSSVYISDLESWFSIALGNIDSNPLYYSENLYIDGVLAEDITIPDGVFEIRNYEFYGLTCLKNVILSDDVSSIGNCAFHSCSSLRNVDFSENVTSIGEGAFFDCVNLTSAALPDNVRSIGNSAFSGCTNLESVTIPEGIEKIGNYTFTDCNSLISVTIPSSVQTIGIGAFKRCTGLADVYINDGQSVSSQNYIYYDCSVLEEIGSEAFEGCSSLKSINIPGSVSVIGREAFEDCGELMDVYITDLGAWLDIDMQSTGQYSWDKNITSNPIYYARNLYINGEPAKDIVIPDGIETIRDYAFYGIESINSVTMPNTVTKIGDYAFASCINLSNVSIPDSVTNIGSYAFSECTALVSVNISDNVISIGSRGFYNCTGLKTAYIGCQTVGTYAFGGCSLLTEVTLSSNVATVNDSAFASCNQLTDVYCARSNSTGLTIGKYNTDLKTATWHYNCSVNFSKTPTVHNLIYISANGGQDIIYNGNTGSYSESEFELNVNVSGLRLDGDYSDETAMKNAIVTITLPDGFSFYEDKSVKARRYEFETLYSVPRISETVHLQSPGVGEFEIVICASADNVTSKKYTHTLSIAEDIFELNKYRAEWFLDSEVRATSESVFYGDLSDTPSRIIYQTGLENNLGDAAMAWSTFMDTLDMIDSPSSILDYAFEEKDIYEAIIMSLFECSVDYSATSILTNEVVKETNSLVSTAAKEMKTLYNVDVYDSSGYSGLSDSEINALAGIISDAYGDLHPTASFISDLTGYIKTASGYVKDFQSLCENIATYGNVRQLTDSMKEVMQDMYNNCPSDNVALKAALLDCISVMDGSELAFAADMSTLVGSVVGKDIVKYCIDEFWGDMKKAFCSAHPAAFTFMAAYIGGKTIANTIFNADDIEEQYCKIAAINEVWDLAESVYIKERNSFSSEDTDETAQIYNSMIDVMFNMLDTDCEYATKYANTIDDAWAQKILDVFGDSTIEDWNAGVESLKATYSDIHKSELTNWIWSLETDFPSRFEDYEYLTELTTSEITSALEIDCPVDVYILNKNGSVLGYVKDNVPYCVEDAKITIGVSGDCKTVYLYDDEYTILYIGNDEGTMDITLTSYDSAGEETRTAYFYGIALSDGVKYTSTADGETIAADTYSLMTEDGEEILPDYDSLNADSDAAYTASITRGYFTSSMAVETELNAGDKAEIAAYIPDGYKFVGWTSDAGYDIFEDAESVTTTITMPDCDVNITAEVEETAALKIASAESGMIEVQAFNCEDLTGTIYISVYDADGVHKATVTAEISESITVTELEFESGDIIRAFLWDENMQPQIAAAQRLAS